MYRSYKQAAVSAQSADILESFPTMISTEFLEEIINRKTPNVRLVDASWHMPQMNRDAKREYDTSHLSGAVFFDLDRCVDKDSPYDLMLPSADVFAKHVGELGINNHMQVILYDNNPKIGMFSSQRIWWMFKVFGHERVSILDGGYPKWVAEGRPTTKDVPAKVTENFNPKYATVLVKGFDDIKENMESNSFTLLDARPLGRYSGTAPEPRLDVKPGHIPGAVNIPFPALMDLESKTMKTIDGLRHVFTCAGVNVNSNIVASCGSGLTGCFLVLGAYLCGNKDVPLYDGSWTEWYFRAPDEDKVDVPP